MTLLKGQLRFMKDQGFDVILLSANGKEVQNVIENEKCTHIPVSLTRKMNPFLDLVCLIQLIIIFKKYKPDIVHTHTPKAGLVGILAAYICNVPIKIHTVAGLPWIKFRGLKKVIMIFLEKLVCNMADRVYPNSKNMMNLMIKYKIGPKKLRIISLGSTNGIDTNWYNIDAEGVKINANKLIESTNLKPGARAWVFLGRLVKDKGIEELINAFHILQKSFKDDQLWLVGEEEPKLNPLSRKYKSLIESNSSIIQWNFQSDIRPFLAASRLLVFPSHREGFPNVPLQAASMECAMILTDINGCNEIVENNISGLLVPIKNPIELYMAMIKLRKDEELQITFSRNVLNKNKGLYEQLNVWNSILREYTKLLRARKIVLETKSI
jgi:glycosyltransferase involved in cell wall biosynthesis